jgi:hypothetical protein
LCRGKEGLEEPDADNPRLASASQQPLEHPSHSDTSSPSYLFESGIRSKSLVYVTKCVIGPMT